MGILGDVFLSESFGFNFCMSCCLIWSSLVPTISSSSISICPICVSFCSSHTMDRTNIKNKITKVHLFIFVWSHQANQKITQSTLAIILIWFKIWHGNPTNHVFWDSNSWRSFWMNNYCWIKLIQSIGKVSKFPLDTKESGNATNNPKKKKIFFGKKKKAVSL